MYVDADYVQMERRSSPPNFSFAIFPAPLWVVAGDNPHIPPFPPCSPPGKKPAKKSGKGGHKICADGVHSIDGLSIHRLPFLPQSRIAVPFHLLSTYSNSIQSTNSLTIPIQSTFIPPKKPFSKSSPPKIQLFPPLNRSSSRSPLRQILFFSLLFVLKFRKNPINPNPPFTQKNDQLSKQNVNGEMTGIKWNKPLID